jgi:regulation of enolase protein 1 (concanavalin A-like superfamily)
MDWLNEPPVWREADGLLEVTTGDRTDFWRRTHYGFTRDDGHLRYASAPGDFAAEVAFQGEYAELYDQAGMMLRSGPEAWIKAGIEYVGGRQMLSVVVTREVSDWSTMPLPVEAAWLRLRLTRVGAAVHVHWATEDGPFTMLRLAGFPEGPAQVGPMCCSPQRAGFRARFRDFVVRAPQAADLSYG